MQGSSDEKNPNFLRNLGCRVDKQSDSSSKESTEHGDFGDSTSSHRLHWKFTIAFFP